MKYKHYAPNTPLTIITELNSNIIGNDEEEWSSIAFIVPKSKVHFIPNKAQFIYLCEDEKISNKLIIIYMKCYIH